MAAFVFTGLGDADPALAAPAGRLLQQLEIRRGGAEYLASHFLARHFLAGYAGHQFEPFLQLFHVVLS